MNRVIIFCFFISLFSCCIAQSGNCSWKQVGQFNENAVSGYFWEELNGFVGFGNYRGGQNAVIRKTTDGGISWTLCNTPSADGAVTAIFMIDKLQGYASIAGTSYPNNYSIWKTTDGGLTWNDHSFGNGASTNCVYATSKALIRTVWYNGNIGGVSLNGGKTFSAIFFTYNGSKSNGIDFTDDLHGVVTMGPADDQGVNPVFYTRDGGVNWAQGDAIPESWAVYGAKGTPNFFALPEDFGFNPGQTVYWSQDGGQHWQQRYSSFPNSPTFTGHIAGAGNTLYVQTEHHQFIQDQGLFRSDDLGASWVNVGGPSNARDTRFAVTGCRGEVVYAFDNNGSVWKTTDGGDGAFGFTPKLGNIKSVKTGDTTRIPIYIDSTGAPFTINQFTGSFKLHTDLLTPFGFDTMGTLSHSMIFDTIYTDVNKNVNFLIKYSKPLKNGIPLSVPIIYIKAVAYLTTTDTTTVTLNSLDINSGASQQSLVVCTSSSSLFTLTNECSDSTLRQFMATGEMPKLLSIMPNPSTSGNITAQVYLPQESEISAEIFDANATYRSYKSSMTYGKGIQNIPLKTSSLPSGEYFLKISLNNGSYLSGRVVITR